MERKIGEIFEFNGEWCQCLEANNHCAGCSFFHTECGNTFKSYQANTLLGKCLYAERSDGKSVIFKKLEKVGEPVKIKGKLFQTYKRATNETIPKWDYDLTLFPNDNGTVAIEIKQTKEDMKEKKQNWRAEDTPLAKLVGKYVNNLIDYETFEKKVKELYSDKEDGSKPTLKEFNLEEAKAGKPVCTRDGRKARIICFDRRDTDNHCIVALIENEDLLNKEGVRSYFDNGKYLSGDEESVHDLMMLPGPY